MRMDKLSVSILAMMVASVCACGGTTQPAASTSPASSPAKSPAATLQSIAAQPADLPALGLQKCDTLPNGKPASGDLSAAGRGNEGEWAAVQAAGAVEGWIQWLGPVCPFVSLKAWVRNDLVRFKDASAAAAFFQSEKANAKTKAIFWPIGGGSHAEGGATGFGPNSVSLVFTGGTRFCVFWSNGSLLISYCSVNFSSADGRSGASAVNARVP